MKRTLADRFWAKVDKNGPVVRPELGPCWVWTAGRDGDGYGRFTLDGRHTRASHTAWYLAHGSRPPKGVMACHKCDNPACVNAEHIFLGGALANNRDAIEKRRRSRGPLVPVAHRPFGARNSNSRLTETQVAQIRAMRMEGHVLRVIAERFKVSIANVSLICLNKAWSQAGGAS